MLPNFPDSPGTEETRLTFPEKNSSKVILVPGEHLRNYILNLLII